MKIGSNTPKTDLIATKAESSPLPLGKDGFSQPIALGAGSSLRVGLRRLHDSPAFVFSRQGDAPVRIVVVESTVACGKEADRLSFNVQFDLAKNELEFVPSSRPFENRHPDDEVSFTVRLESASGEKGPPARELRFCSRLGALIPHTPADTKPGSGYSGTEY